MTDAPVQRPARIVDADDTITPDLESDDALCLEEGVTPDGVELLCWLPEGHEGAHQDEIDGRWEVAE